MHWFPVEQLKKYNLTLFDTGTHCKCCAFTHFSRGEVWFLSNTSKTFCPSFHFYQTLLVCGPNCLNLCRDCSKAFSNSGWALFSSLSVQPSQSMSSQTGNLTLPCPSSALLVMKYKLQGARCGYTGEKNQPNLSLSTFSFVKGGLAVCVNQFLLVSWSGSSLLTSYQPKLQL